MWLLSELEWDSAIDLGALQQLNYFEGIELTDDMFMQDTLNDFISDGKKTWRLYVIVS
jgi:fumarylacetoacetase